MADSSTNVLAFPGVRSAWWRRLVGMFSGGTMFDGARDLYKVFGYKQSPRFEDFLFKYVRQDIAKRIIDAPVKATWSDPPLVEAEGDEFLSDWQNLHAGHQVWHALQTLDKLAGIGQFAILLVGIDDGRPLSTEVRNDARTSVRKVTYLQCYMESSVNIIEYDTSPTSPRFGLPQMYEITPQDAELARTVGNSLSGQYIRSGKRDKFQVHWSRVLHVADNTLENVVYGSSRLESVYNLLDDLLKVVGGSAETFWLTANRGMQVDVDKDMSLRPEDQADMEDELSEFEHGLRRYVRTRGVKMNVLGSDTPDPQGNADTIIGLIAAATGIPKRILQGSEAGQLASTQDRANLSNRIQERLADFAQPVILFPFVMMMIRMGVCRPPSKFWITWPETFKLSPLERAQTAAQMARSAANLQKVMHEPVGTVRITEETEEEDPGIPAVTERDEVTGEERVITPAVPGSGRRKVTRVYFQGGETLLTREEARNIIGHGKHVPIFDEVQDSSNALLPAPGASTPRR